MIFCVWSGNDSFLECVRFDEEIWNCLSSASTFAVYAKAAVPYLADKGRRTPSNNQEAPVDDSVYSLEKFQPEILCQSRILSRNGSNACTIICALFVQKVLSATIDIDDDESRNTKLIMCESMVEGNHPL